MAKKAKTWNIKKSNIFEGILIVWVLAPLVIGMILSLMDGVHLNYFAGGALVFFFGFIIMLLAGVAFEKVKV